MCREEDSNLHARRHMVLNHAWLPITPSRLFKLFYNTFQSVGLLLHWSTVVVFAMMASLISIGMLLLIQVQIYNKVRVLQMAVNMKSRKSASRHWQNKTHFASFVSSKNISGSSKKVNRVFFNFFKNYFHVGVSGVVPPKRDPPWAETRITQIHFIISLIVGALRIELSLRPPEGRVLPVYYAPFRLSLRKLF